MDFRNGQSGLSASRRIEFAFLRLRALTHALHQTLDLILATQRLIRFGRWRIGEDLRANAEHLQSRLVGSYVGIWSLREGRSQRFDSLLGGMRCIGN